MKGKLRARKGETGIKSVGQWMLRRQKWWLAVRQLKHYERREVSCVVQRKNVANNSILSQLYQYWMRYRFRGIRVRVKRWICGNQGTGISDQCLDNYRLISWRCAKLLSSYKTIRAREVFIENVLAKIGMVGVE